MTLILDSGALLALERRDRAMWVRLKRALLTQQPPRTHGGILGQVWRGRGPRQALLATALQGLECIPLDAGLGKRSGELLARAGKSDVVDAALVLLAVDEDLIVTSDPDDLEPLARAAHLNVDLVTI